MKTHLQGVERRLPLYFNNKLTVDHKSFDWPFPQKGDHLGEVTPQRFTGFRSKVNLAAFLEGQTAKPVPFGLVLPIHSFRQLSAERASIGGVSSGSAKDPSSAAPVVFRFLLKIVHLGNH